MSVLLLKYDFLVHYILLDLPVPSSSTSVVTESSVLKNFSTRVKRAIWTLNVAQPVFSS